MKHKIELVEGAQYLQSFGLELQRTPIDALTDDEWRKLQIPAHGKFLPARQLAIYNEDAPGAVSTLFHEAFGHGLVCEHTKLGGNLVEAATHGTLEEYLSKTSTQGVYPQNFHNFEGFATWLEAILCEETDNMRSWSEKQKLLNQPETQYYLQLREGFLETESQLSRFGVFAQMGFPKHYDSEIVVDVLRHMYGKNFKNIKAAMLYGSQRPNSDIDVFVISDNRSEFFNGWLDITQRDLEDSLQKCKSLDICVTDPLFSGELIYGDQQLVQELRAQACKATPQGCQTHSLYRATIARERAKEYSGFIRQRCLDYEQSYLQMAQALAQGKNPMTRDDLYKLDNI